MRSAAEMRERWLAELPMMITRPGMWARGGGEMETVAGIVLRNLCFLDDRDDEYDRVVGTLRGFGKLGVYGPFEAVFGGERRCTDEVASVYAEQFHRLGYLAVERQLTRDEWAAFAGLCDWVADRDVRRSEVESTFGPPSLVIGKRVLCYVPDDGTGWVFVDCWDEATRRYVPGKGTYDAVTETDSLVRDIRVPAADFDDGMILTLYGRVLRWGPGWWIHHTSGEVAAQLRQIEADDPSQRRRERGSEF